MTQTSYSARVARVLEQHEIHNAVCRARKQGLCCSTCTELSERAARARRILAAQIAEAA